MFCVSCRHQLPDDARFCSSCGRPTADETIEADPVTLADFDAAMEAEDWAKAVVLGERLLGSAPNDEALRDRTSSAYVQLAKLPENDAMAALDRHKALLERAVELDPLNRSAWTWLRLAVDWRSSDAYERTVAVADRAIGAFTHALLSDPLNIEARKGRAEAYRWRSDHTGKSWERGRLPEHDLAIEDIRAALSLTPDDVEAWSELGHVHMSLREYGESIEAYSTAAEKSADPKGNIYERIGTARMLLASSRASDEGSQALTDELAAGLRQLALTDFTHAVDLGWYDAYKGRAHALAELGDCDAAMQDLARYMSHVQGEGSTIGWSAVDHDVSLVIDAYFNRGDNHKAMELARSFLDRLKSNELQDRSFGVSQSIERIYVDAVYHHSGNGRDFTEGPVARFIEEVLGRIGGRFREDLLRDVCQRGLSLSPDAITYGSEAYKDWESVHLAWLARIEPRGTLPTLAQALFFQGKYAESLKRYRELSELEPSSHIGYAGMVNCYTRLNDLPSAKHFVWEAIKFADASAKPELLGQQGELMKQSDEFENAIESYSEAITLDPGHSDAWRWHHGRGACYEQMSELKLALEDYRAEHRLSPSEYTERDIRQLEERLRQL